MIKQSQVEELLEELYKRKELLVQLDSYHNGEYLSVIGALHELNRTIVIVKEILLREFN